MTRGRNADSSLESDGRGDHLGPGRQIGTIAASAPAD